MVQKVLIKEVIRQCGLEGLDVPIADEDSCCRWSKQYKIKAYNSLIGQGLASTLLSWQDCEDYRK